MQPQLQGLYDVEDWIEFIGWRDNKALLSLTKINWEVIEIQANMASKAMKKKESKERVASAARTIPE